MGMGGMDQAANALVSNLVDERLQALLPFSSLQFVFIYFFCMWSLSALPADYNSG